MIIKIFEEQAKKYPNNIAVKSIEKEITYDDLNNYANITGKIILNECSELNLENNECNIALLFEHGIDMIIGTVGALKLNMMYVPFAPSYPIDRLKYMLEDSGSRVIVTNDRNIELAKQLLTETNLKISIVNLDEIEFSAKTDNLEIEYREDKIAYLLYTSGTTGQPKGVIQTHKNILHFIKCYTKMLSITRKDRMTLFSAFSHDAAVMDIYGALLNGATLYPLNIKNQMNINELSVWLKKEEITIWHSVPTVYRYFINSLKGRGEFPQLRYIVLGGESVIEHDIDTFKDLFGHTKLIHLYGQSESSFNSYQVFSSESEDKKIHLGCPVEETEILVIDENREEVLPLGVGQIVILSEFIALGYWNDNEKTKSVFEYDNEVGKLYWTGDLGRVLEDGNIEFLGREDQQVKIRGFRIELGEIQGKILEFEKVKEAVVIDREDEIGNKYLCAYLTSEKEIAIGKLREHLSRSLPDYMIPSYFVKLEELPVTPNGKIDRRALQKIGANINTSGEYEEPRNEVEEKLVFIWKEVLGREQIGINDNFFEFGGHSLKATSVIAKAHKELEIEIPLKQIFLLPTIKELSEWIKGQESKKYIAIEQAEQRDYYPVSSAQKMIYTIQQFEPKSKSYNMPKALLLEGKFDLQKIEEIFVKIIQRHESLRTSFEIYKEEIIQKIHSEVDFKIKYDKETNEKKLEEKLNKFVQPFDLGKAPLLRVGLIEIEPDKHILMYDIHHIVSDGISMGTLTRELVELYGGKELPKLRIQYKDYAVWQNKKENIQKIEEQEKYWSDTLGKDIPLLNMPLDIERKEIQTFTGKTIYKKLDRELTEKLDFVSQKLNTTMNVLLLSFYSILLSEYCDQEDIIVGSTISNRNHLDIQNIIGPFINFLPIKSKVNKDQCILEFIKSQKRIIEDAYNNQDCPFEKIVENADVRSNKGRNPIFDTMLIYHNEMDVKSELSINGLKLENFDFQNNTTKLDFKLDIFLGNQNELNCYLEYNTDLYKEESMIALVEHYEFLIDKVINNMELKISDIALFNEEEKLLIEQKRKASSLSKTLAVVSTFTCEPIEEYVRWWCLQNNENIDVKFASYNQVFQELLNPDSLISKNKDINLIMIRFEDWIRGIKLSDRDKCEIIKNSYNNFLKAIQNLNKSAQNIIGIFPVSTHLELSSEIIEYIANLNRTLKNELKTMEQISVLDFSKGVELYNVKEIFDSIKDKEGHMPFSDEYYAVMGTMIARKICAFKGNPFKVIAVDCDNTLWKGICGEDGPLGVCIEKPHIDLQRLLIEKQNEGMLIVLCSKNNEQDVWDVFNKNSKMLLKKEHLAAWQINWKEKSENIRLLAKELNLGMDSFIFIDDSLKECHDMMINNPQILSLQLPEDPLQISSFLEHVWAFDKKKITEEDKVRTKYYQAEKKRKEIKNISYELEDFLKELNLRIYINEVEGEQIPRVAQLTQRTNQFNLSTIRRTEDEIKVLIKKTNIKCWVIEIEDKFGEYGLTGVIIMENINKQMFLDTFLLSCRVLGRNVEEAVMVELCRYCQRKGIKKIETNLYPTFKNHIVAEYFDKSKWSKIKETNEYIKYEMKVEENLNNVEFVECSYGKKYKKEKHEEITKEIQSVFDHIGVSVNEIESVRDYYQTLNYVSTQTVYDPKQNAELILLSKNGCGTIELIKFMNNQSMYFDTKNGNHNRPYHLCYRVKAFDELIEKLNDCDISWEIIKESNPAVVFGGKEVLFIYVNGVGLIEFIQDKDYDYDNKKSLEKEDLIRVAVEKEEDGIKFYNMLGYIETDRAYNVTKKVLSIVLTGKGSEKIELLVWVGNDKKNPISVSARECNIQHICHKYVGKEFPVELLNNKKLRYKDVTMEHRYGGLSESTSIIQSEEIKYNIYYLAEEMKRNFIKEGWQIKLHNEKEFLHINQILPLKYHSGQLLLGLPIYENKDNVVIERFYEAPGNDLEEKLCEIWREILRIEKIGINDNFFELGGNSLKGTVLSSRIHKKLDIEVPLGEIFKTPTIKGIAKYLHRAEKNLYLSINKVEEQEYYEASSAQKRMYMLQQFDLTSTRYNMPFIMEVEGELDKERLEKAIKKLVQRHETLRTYFELIGGEIKQKVKENVEFHMEYIKLHGESIEEISKNFIRPFDLSKAPLLRAGLIEIQPEKYLLMFDMHHIISDGVSMTILINEFVKLYEGEELKELRIQYKDFAAWQNGILKSEEMKKQEEYWMDKFGDKIPKINIATDYPRQMSQSYHGEQIGFIVDKETTRRLKGLSRDTGSTMYMTILSCINILLSKHSNQEDIIVGSPIAGRNHTDLEDVIGIFINTLAMRNKPKSDKIYEEFLKEVKQNSLKAFENQDYQFEELVNKLNLERDISRNPLFDIMFIMQNIDNEATLLENVSFKLHKGKNRISRFDITIIAVEEDDEIFLRIEYSTKLFNRKTIERMGDHLVNILRAVSKNRKLKLSEIEVLAEEEKQKLLYGFNDTQVEYPRDKTIHELFEEQVEKTPDKIAVVFDDKKLTYRELNEKSNRLARTLRKKGTNSDSLVAIMIEPSLDMIISIMAVLKSGSAYLPIDPAHPKERINYILMDSCAKHIITESKLLNELNFCGEVLDIEDKNIYNEDFSRVKNISKPKDLAYVIYTSGSTGNPKGVMVEHKNVVNFVKGMQEKFDYNTDKRMLALTTMSFDIFVLETIVPLLSAITVIIAEEKHKVDPHELSELIKNKNINMMQLTPSRLKLLCEDKENINCLTGIEELIIGGEKFPDNLYSEIKEKCLNTKIYNVYGPTETTVWSTIKLIQDRQGINIGQPIANTQIFILNKDNKLQPIGVFGELCVAGDGVARGYFNRPELTKEKFIEVPFNEKGKVYKTGDVARILGNGNIEIIGRMDNQIKMNGYRIEVEEIEKKIQENSDVKDCVVTVKENQKGDIQLYAYIVPNINVNKTKNNIISTVREELSKKLPAYMVPVYFGILDKIPLNSNGKINRIAIENYDVDVVKYSQYIEPKTKIEKEFADLWEEILLSKEKIGIRDNFFEIGGNSLSAIKFVMRAKENYQLSTNDVFKYPTIEELARSISYEKYHLKEKLNSLKTIHNSSTEEFRRTFEGKEYSDKQVRKMVKKSLKRISKDYHYTYRDVNLDEIKKYENILLTGSTGYVGIHILYELLKSTDYNIYVLIRGKSLEDAENRLCDNIKFSFDEGTHEAYKNRIKVILGDMTEKRLGLGVEEYYDLSQKVDCIINSASNVSHFTQYKDSYNVNVKGVKNLIEFAKNIKYKDLNHISTMGVSSGKIRDKRFKVFSEQCKIIHNIDQDRENNYIKTKTIAEELVIRARKSNLNTNIFRLGNVVFNSHNGRFQKNINTNSFYLQLRALKKFGIAPSFETNPLELSFVDVVSESIVKLMTRKALNNEIYHVYNTKSIELSTIAKCLNIKEVSIEEFIEYINKNINENEELQQYLETFIAHSGITDRYFRTIFVQDCYKTEKLLESIGVKWFEPKEEHIERMLNYSMTVGFFK